MKQYDGITKSSRRFGPALIAQMRCALTLAVGLISCSGSDELKLADLTTKEIVEITTNSARSGGSILSDGGTSVTARGVCWSSLNPTPTVADDRTNDGVGIGSYVSLLNGLMPNTYYHLRAYATTDKGTSYGLTISFATEALTVTTNDISEITGTSCKTGGNITSIEGLVITERGVCWDVNPNSTTANFKTSDGIGSGVFTSAVTNLNPSTKYYIRAFAVTNFGTYYAIEKTFTTKN